MNPGVDCDRKKVQSQNIRSMESIDELLTILRTRTPGDSLAHITLSPSAWLLLHACATERWFFWTGFGSDEIGPLLTDENPRPTITFDAGQSEEFRLWDREGREILHRAGVAFGGIKGDC
jgi:hypothetical protein